MRRSAFRPLLLAALAGALAAAPPARAVRAPETTRLGQSPTRLPGDLRGAAAWWEAQPAWRAFTEGEGAGWEARWDAAQGVPLRMWGPGIAVGTLRDAQDAGKAALAFAQRHADLLGARGYAVRVASTHHADDLDAWYVDLDLVAGDLPAFRAGLTLRFMQGRLTLVGSRALRDAPLTGALALSVDDAYAAAATQGAAPGALHERLGADAVAAPTRGPDGRWGLRAAWHTVTRTSAPIGRWESLVDAETGTLLYQWNTVRFFDGELLARHDDRLAQDLITSPLPFAEVRGGGRSVYSDLAGQYTVDVDEGEGLTLDLDGLAVRMRDQLGDIDPTFLAAPSTTFGAPQFGDRQSPLTTYVYLHQAQLAGLRMDPANDWPRTRVDANVNIDDVCNAYFDGDVNFFRAGGGCNNTGRLADVIFHEWGHGLHTYAIVSGFYDGSLGEGAADTFAWLITDDHRIAPTFFEGGGTLRDVENTMRYPDDFVADETYIHYNGMIYGGAMWDTREALRATVGEPEATAVMEGIYGRMLRAGPDIPTAYEEALFADDDDGDLGNGTPHQCELIEGFGKHGLGPKGYRGLAVQHEPILDPTPDAPIPLAVSVDSPAPECFETRADAATVRYKILGGPTVATAGGWQEAELSVSGTDAAGALPPLPAGTVVSYYVEVDDGQGGTAFAPADGKIRPYTFVVGPTLEVHCDNFERSRADYTSELVAGDDVEGANDWQWGEPIGDAGDPPSASSGDKVWGNDLGGDAYNGNYQDGKHNRLTSPALPTYHYAGVFLRYQRWLTIEDGVYDQAAISADGAEVWSNWASNEDKGDEHHLDDAWADHVVPLDGAGDDGSVTLAWDLTSDQGLNFGGWNLDDVCLYAPDTPDNRLGVWGLTASIDETTATLTWTMPRHDPVTEVRVVRKTGAPPTGPEDGAVVYKTSQPALAEVVTATDPCAAGADDLFYAVYASDGASWLSWTRPGLNLASVSPTDRAVVGEDRAACVEVIRASNQAGRDGCGCDSPGSAPGALGALTGLAAALVRRRARR